MNIQALATMVEDMNKALYKALPDVEGIHLRYYESSLWLIAWNSSSQGEDLVLINTMEDSLTKVTLTSGFNPQRITVDMEVEDVKHLLAERFAKAYAEKLVDKLKEDVDVSQC